MSASAADRCFLHRYGAGRLVRDVSAETPCAEFHKPLPRRRAHIDPDRAYSHDREMYLEVRTAGGQLTSPDAQLDQIIDFVARAPEDIMRLIAEVRRLRGRPRSGHPLLPRVVRVF